MRFKEIIIFHYHLRKGGVTDVVLLSLQAMASSLNKDLSVRIVVGCKENLDSVQNQLEKNLKQPLNLLWEVLPDINYIEEVKKPPTLQVMQQKLLQQFGGKEKLWWVHNYHLGKNPLFTAALLKAAEEQQPMLLQIHDFPECARYENLEKLRKGVKEEIYPLYPWIKYALINPRDYRLMEEAGIPSSQLFLLENPVPLQPLPTGDSHRIKEEMGKAWGKDFPAFDPEGALLLYPVRAIRRKNVLEAGLLVKLLKRSANLLVTLPGVSESESAYSRLVEDAFRKGWLPGACGVGMNPDTPWLNYQNFWLAADTLISSSIQEGFGYLYLNSLHWRKPLCTRYLDIMEGFSSLFPKESSIFYQEITVPLSSEQEKKVLREYSQKLDRLKVYMGQEKTRKLLNELKEKLENKKLCFSYLSAEIQIELIRRIHEDETFRERCREANIELLNKLEEILDKPVPDRNHAIEKAYGGESYIEALEKILGSYGQEITLSSPAKHSVQRTLVEGFTTLPYIRLLY